ncbi:MULTISPECIES: SctK family type III secretion system sorting platform protein [unclassified Mesorhizobium]|uniref:SctK family type III secretion system sorting platform protein n=1 Tax=unclassified Mesorhizobium TaxID=325217 RepID=UPI0024161716|nr:MULTISPECIES: SctK family type III secretion system sorting platform protein [unclassified Mesorhizobium]WFP65773.1 SctK family type III secretion system sorting platform protein [Mesorhizobium sp. WSM4904]WFP79035.1 SctK family type III secretion system sorting platform protein [Mesorhizobium sp. WSM4906]
MTGTGSGQAASPEWQAFISGLASYADAARLAECFDGAISEAACQRMLQSQRLHERLSKLLLEHYRLSRAVDEPSDDVDRAIALLSGEELEDLALRSGAIYWAGNLAAVIDGREADALQAALGADLCTFAVANRDLAGPARALQSLEDIRVRVYADGLSCLGGWCQAMPGETGARVRIKLVPNEFVDRTAKPFIEVGPAIVRRAMG